MSLYSLHLTLRAQEDINRFWDYVPPDDWESAERFIDRLFERTEKLAGFPHMGPPDADLSGVRALVFGRFKVFYTVNEATRTVMVLRFWGTHRDFPSREDLSG
ncbi:MAG: type II toxin-antitoxin system RelE/ParE family toxin [Methylacidiphilales bacterium]|nr:type II toxin-antitoxin system RelE/ParE family toxin [Candidatus Methylacidiphilales bacterium]